MGEGGMGWDTRPVLKCIRVGYSQNSSKITHMHQKSHLVNITFCFCLYFSFYTTWQFVVLCHISELRFTNIWLVGNIPVPKAPQCLWDRMFATYQLRWKTRVFLENNVGKQGIWLHKIPLKRRGLGKLTHWLPPRWTLKRWKTLAAFGEWPVKWVPLSPQWYENLLN